MRRLFWVSVGAVGGFYVARRGERAVEEARERGFAGSVSLAASSATKAATGASRVVVGVGAKAGSATRRRLERPAGAVTPVTGTAPSPKAPESPTSSREVRA